MDEIFSDARERVSSAFGRLPSLAALTAFEAVARHQSFAKAAEELNVTQSAVSHRIRSLEQQFNSRFFVRSQPAVVLTSQGAFFLGAVIQALSTLDMACARLTVQRRVVRISLGPAFARSWLVERLGDFYRSHADIDVDVNAVKLSQTNKLECLRTGEADVAIRYGGPLDWPGFQCTELMPTELFPVCSPAYKTEHDLGATPKSLLRATLLRSPRQPWLPWFRAVGLDADEPDQGPQFSDAALMLDAAARGQGVALARSTLVEHDLATGRLTRVFDTSITSSQSYHAIYHRSPDRAEVTAFIDWITQQAKGRSVTGGEADARVA